MDLSPHVRRPVKPHNASHGQLSHGSVSKEVHARVQVGRHPAKMGASATEVARAFAVNPNVLHRWWREFHLRPGNAWASGLDDPGGRTTRCLLETDMTRKDREAMSERPLDPVRRNFLSAAGAFGAAVALGAGASSQAQNVPTAHPPASGASPGPGAQAGVRQAAEGNSGEIPRRPLGRTGAQVSALGVGGHLELYKSTKSYDGAVGREQHGYPPAEKLPL
jgi:transposase-like protein